MKQADNNLLCDIKAAPTDSIYWRNLGGGKVEIISVVCGRVTRLGTTKNEEIIAIAESLSHKEK